MGSTPTATRWPGPRCSPRGRSRPASRSTGPPRGSRNRSAGRSSGPTGRTPARCSPCGGTSRFAASPMSPAAGSPANRCGSCRPAAGPGQNLQATIAGGGGGAVPARVALVVSNVPGAFALERARSCGIPAVVVDHRAFAPASGFGAALREAVDAHGVELLCLAGFLRILSPRFVAAYAGRIMNIHPALLPAFGGRGMYGERVHLAVLASGARTSGATVHFVTDVPDGGPIIAQAAVPVEEGDTPATL